MSAQDQAAGVERLRGQQCLVTSAGPFGTEREALDLPAVRAVYAAFGADPGAGKMAPHNCAMLLDACADAGVAVGAYDSRILHWLAQWEPATCAVIAGLITRARAAGLGTARELEADAGIADMKAAGDRAVLDMPDATGLMQAGDQ